MQSYQVGNWPIKGWKQTKKLPVFRITLSDGDVITSAMASGTTLEKAKEYYMPNLFVAADEKTMRSVISVEQIEWE